ncbi:hypothetical protein ACFE04_008663 [Oxalis oulophora]
MASSFSSSSAPLRSIIYHGGPQRSTNAAAYYNCSIRFSTNHSVIGTSSFFNQTRYRHVSTSITCFLGSTAPVVNVEQLSAANTTIPSDAFELGSALDFISSSSFLVADLDPETAKLGISILGPFLSGFAFLFIVRIIMSWYPKLPVDEFPYVIAYAPTEPFLTATRKVIPPLAGVDVTPVVWFGLVTFLNEILLGPQGLLVLVSQQR